MNFIYLAMFIILSTIFFSCNANVSTEATSGSGTTTNTGSSSTSIQPESLNTANVFYYKGTSFTFTSVGVHGNAPAKVRFNEIANKALVDGKLPMNAKFPEGSLIVKEIYLADSKTARGYAVMKKDSSSPYQSAGWLWSEFPANGQSYFNIGITSKGSACLGCHNDNPYDRTLIFTAQP